MVSEENLIQGRKVCPELLNILKRVLPALHCLLYSLCE